MDLNTSTIIMESCVAPFSLGSKCSNFFSMSLNYVYSSRTTNHVPYGSIKYMGRIRVDSGSCLIVMGSFVFPFLSAAPVPIRSSLVPRFL
jgi:hypothetical protein